LLSGILSRFQTTGRTFKGSGGIRTREFTNLGGAFAPAGFEPAFSPLLRILSGIPQALQKHKNF